MADDTASETPAPLELLHHDNAGYCDPVTGICELPGAAGSVSVRVAGWDAAEDVVLRKR